MGDDITRTKANVRALEGCIYAASAEAGGTIEAGEVVRLDGTNGWVVSDASDATGLAGLHGIMVAPLDAVDGTDGLSVVLFGRVTGYSGMTPGALHFVSNTAGEINTATGAKTKRVGYAETATILVFQPNAPADPT